MPSALVTWGPRSRKVACPVLPCGTHGAVLVEVVVPHEHPRRAGPNRAPTIHRALQTDVHRHPKHVRRPVGDERREEGVFSPTRVGGAGHHAGDAAQHDRPPHFLTHRLVVGRDRSHHLPLRHDRPSSTDPPRDRLAGTDGLPRSPGHGEQHRRGQSVGEMDALPEEGAAGRDRRGRKQGQDKTPAHSAAPSGIGLDC